MPTMTRDQYDAGLDMIMAKYERLPRTLTETDKTNLNRELAVFKRTAVITETTATRQPAASKPAKRPKRERRVARVVRETLTAAAVPRPSPRTAPQAAPKTVAPETPLHGVDPDQLGALTAERFGAGTQSRCGAECASPRRPRR
jgi:hypothetical protein